MDSKNNSSSTEQFILISTIVVLILSLFYKYFKIWIRFWQTHSACELGIPILGTHWREIFHIETWHNTVKCLYYKYPDDRFVILHEIGGRPAYLIRDPELVKKIAISDFSSFVDRISGFHPVTDPVQGHKLTNTVTDDWKRIRNLLTPLMSGQKLKQIMIPSLDEHHRDLVQFLDEKMHDNQLIVDMMDLSTRSVVDGFCAIAFGVKGDSLRSTGDEYGFYESAISFLKHRSEMTKATYWAIIHHPRIMKFLFGKTLMPQRDNDFFIASCNEIADNRIAKQIKRSDYMHLLQTLRDKTSTDNTGKTSDYNEIEAISQFYDFFQSILTENNIITPFLSLQLATNTEVQEQLYAEYIKIKKRIGEKELTYDDLNEMKYTEMVIYEGLRMCPIVTELKRRATKRYELENSNGEKVIINPGDAVWLPAFTMQNDPQYYPNPNVFDPERFNDENRKSHVTGTYAPFGIGPRDCLGCKHPIIDLKIMFYYLLLKFKIMPTTVATENNKNSIKLVRRNDVTAQ